ncbi:DNA repair protein RadA/Sms [Hathewaya proteolytica DSM 3090]|uniref:DNA repair protein RadA n=1 Tax=Hathewaya proteolytica DSM 3090 TaxID=1121331 RepID=A0A1M6T526_9CLOT|nr:DNA repair protein RadA [Hathewaya proteolytica]SHK52093.1 DNA repair protein RadA/Sms [Hathewaya proteolytica DSM 3090]
MGKIKSVFVCQDCGYETSKWLGKCPQCNKWNTFVEEIERKSDTRATLIKNTESSPRSISEIKSGKYERIDTKINEVNRVLGGGLVRGSVTLISGDPGIGKSTLLLQCAGNISGSEGLVLYVSGEESEEQIKMRAERLGINNKELYIVAETNVDNIEAHIKNLNPKFVIIDSIQTMYKEGMSSAPGSVSQVRECSNFIIRIGKTMAIPLFIVAHVTKQGELAGPRVLEHMVDTVLHFEGERTQEYRILRTIKNRFGTTSEIGVFEMKGAGLIEVTNPSITFLENSSRKVEGSSVVGIVEGTRPVLVEIQALVTETRAPIPRRTVIGIDISRLNLILAVLEKKLKLPFYCNDVYVNVVGGLNLDGTYADLGIAMAIVSSIKSKALSLENLLIIGEIGLTGEIRSVAFADKLVGEGIKLGFKNFIVPANNEKNISELLKSSRKEINVQYVSDIRQCINKVF